MKLRSQLHSAQTWTLASISSQAVNRSSGWSAAGAGSAVETANPAGAYAFQLARSMGIQILASQAA